MVLGSSFNIAYETSSSQNYRLWGYTFEICRGINFGQGYTQQPENIFSKLISNTFVTKSISRHDVASGSCWLWRL